MLFLPKKNAFVLARVTRGTKKKVLSTHGVSNLKPSGLVGQCSSTEENSVMREAITRFKTVICQNHSMFLMKALLQKSSDSFSYWRELSFSYAGVALGRGVYFARDASYSLGYARGGGTRHMYLARVLVGQYCQGNSNMIVPPAKNPARPEILYESVVDNPGNPAAFVVFYDNQCYPEYLITIQ